MTDIGQNESGEKKKWDEQSEELLVDLWCDQECLYNITSKDYFNRDLKRREMEKIADALGTSADEVKKKMTNLRTQYGKLRRKGPSGSGLISFSRREKWLEERLAFLSPFMTAKATVSNLEKKRDTDHTEELELLVAADLDDAKCFDVVIPQVTSQTGPTPPKKKKESVEEKEMKIMEELLKSVTKVADNRDRLRSEDEDVFGQFVAGELRKIKNEQVKNVTKMKIHTALFDGIQDNFAKSKTLEPESGSSLHEQ